MVLKVESLPDLKVNIKEPEVLRYLGYKKRAVSPSAEVMRILKDAIDRGYQLAQPKAIYSWVKIMSENDGLLALEGGFELHLGKSSKFWAGAENLAIALCTIGSGLENEVSELFAQEESALALMLDSVGTAAVESVADYVNYLICQQADQLGVKIGPRLSPGYSGWRIEDQKVLFTMLPADTIGVRLSESCIMIPQKSVSFGAGVGKDIDTGKIHPCQHCDMKICQYRA